MTRIRAIETQYKGYRFRSRLEARWAVFFDVLGINWIYEKEGFDLGELGWYLPDFWFPTFDCWGEVKPDTFTPKEFAKCAALPEGCILFDVPEPEARKGYYCTAGNWPDGSISWDAYLAHDEFNHIILHVSAAEKRLWWEFPYQVRDYFPDGDAHAATLAARSAQFEHGRHGLPRVDDWGKTQYGELPY